MRNEVARMNKLRDKMQEAIDVNMNIQSEHGSINDKLDAFRSKIMNMNVTFSDRIESLHKAHIKLETYCHKPNNFL